MTDFYKKKKFSLLIFALEASQVVYFFTYSKVGFPAEITFGVKQVTIILVAVMIDYDPQKRLFDILD